MCVDRSISPPLMVTVLNRRRHGYDVIIYPKDHDPAHVHVFRGGKEVLININDWSVIENYGFHSRELRRIFDLLKEYESVLIDTWDHYPGSFNS